MIAPNQPTKSGFIPNSVSDSMILIVGTSNG